MAGEGVRNWHDAPTPPERTASLLRRGRSEGVPCIKVMRGAVESPPAQWFALKGGVGYKVRPFMFKSVRGKTKGAQDRFARVSG